MQGPLRQLPHIPSTLEAEDASPDAIEMNRNDRRIDAFHNAFKTGTKRKHLADSRHLAFGENANNFPVANRIARIAQRTDHVPGALLGRYRYGIYRSGEKADDRTFVVLLLDQETNRTLSRACQQHGIDERQMVADKQRAAF